MAIKTITGRIRYARRNRRARVIHMAVKHAAVPEERAGTASRCSSVYILVHLHSGRPECRPDQAKRRSGMSGHQNHHESHQAKSVCPGYSHGRKKHSAVPKRPAGTASQRSSVRPTFWSGLHRLHAGTFLCAAGRFSDQASGLKPHRLRTNLHSQC